MSVIYYHCDASLMPRKFCLVPIGRAGGCLAAAYCFDIIELYATVEQQRRRINLDSSLIIIAWFCKLDSATVTALINHQF